MVCLGKDKPYGGVIRMVRQEWGMLATVLLMALYFVHKINALYLMYLTFPLSTDDMHAMIVCL